ncbi:hypothetical protein [Pseudomonas sp.]|uniref:hypothetical protein n=1 Tax=Pseudomonas sp. TaxID=306 RepID=UPI0028A6A2FF|nr:hypothetical protein [Pseudomonas sp.]
MRFRVVALLVLLGPLVSACTEAAFKPPKADVEQWHKPGASKADVLAAMRACGEPNASGIDPKAGAQERAERFVCMKRAGFTRRDGFDMCALPTVEPLKACQALQ